MLEVIEKKEGTTLTIRPEGQMNLTTSPAVAEKVTPEYLTGVTKLVFDLEALDYLSSAGLRVFLAAAKSIGEQGEIVITGANPEIMDILEMAGLPNIMTIE